MERWGEQWGPALAEARASLATFADQAQDVWDQVNDATDGKLWILALAAAVFLAVLATPAPKGAQPALAAARALSATAVAVFATLAFLPH